MKRRNFLSLLGLSTLSLPLIQENSAQAVTPSSPPLEPLPTLIPKGKQMAIAPSMERKLDDSDITKMNTVLQRKDMLVVVTEPGLIHLPAAEQVNHRITIKFVGQGILTVQALREQKIEKQNQFVIRNQYDSLNLASDGKGNWWIV